MTATTSLVMIIPATKRDDANVVGQALDHGPSTFGVALQNAQEQITHYGSHAWASDGFMAVLAGAGQGTLPMPADGRTWAEWGLFDAAVWDMFAELAYDHKPIGSSEPSAVNSITDSEPSAFFKAFAADNGLSVPVVEEV